MNSNNGASDILCIRAGYPNQKTPFTSLSAHCQLYGLSVSFRSYGGDWVASASSIRKRLDARVRLRSLRGARHQHELPIPRHSEDAQPI